MKHQPGHMITTGHKRLLLTLIVIITSSAGLALADGNSDLANSVAGTFTPTQIFSLVASATGKGDPRIDQLSPSLTQLQQLLGVSSGATQGLLQILDRPDIRPEQSLEALVESAIQYKAIRDRLAEVTAEDPEGRRLAAQAQAAMIAGRFGISEGLLQQLEDHEVASSGDITLASRSSGGVAVPRASAVQHLIRAAEARTLLGEIALMKMRYGEATDDFQMAQQRLAVLPPAELNSVELEPGSSSPASELAGPGNGDVTAAGSSVTPTQLLADTAPANSAAIQPAAETDRGLHLGFGISEQPASVRVELAGRSAPDDKVPAATGSDTVAVNQPVAVITAARRDFPKQVPWSGAALNGPSASSTVPADVLALLLRRGDALLALGDVSSARLFYERAAAGGDGTAAARVGKTYDPQFLLVIGARGIQADPSAAAAWYRRATELGDMSATERLKHMSQGRDR